MVGGACFQIRNKITARGDYPNMIYINLPKDSERKEYMDLWTQGMAEHKKKLITKEGAISSKKAWHINDLVLKGKRLRGVQRRGRSCSNKPVEMTQHLWRKCTPFIHNEKYLKITMKRFRIEEKTTKSDSLKYPNVTIKSLPITTRSGKL